MLQELQKMVNYW